MLSIDTTVKNPVQQNVPEPWQNKRDYKKIQIVSIEFVGYEDVYNMEVPEFHNFAVNGGIIVHNCIDSLRYCTQNIGRNNFSF